MSQYRSDSVAYFRILLPNESAWEIMNKLGRQCSYSGQRKLVHLVPSGLPLLSKPFLQQLRRCDEALNKMETFDSILKGKRIYTATYELQPYF